MHQKEQMRVIALIDDLAVVRRILTHLGLWAPQHALHLGRAPPVAPDAWPAHPSLALMYNPGPGIV